MEQIIKQTREVGTSAGVLLPRNWLNKQVVVTLLQPSHEQIFQDVMEIIFIEKLNEETKGVYLFGSYARGDFDSNSDIDILVITEKTNRLINRGNYEILVVSEEKFSKNLKNNLNYLGALRELKVLLNKELIERYKNGKIEFNIKGYLSEIGNVLKINKETIKNYVKILKNIPDGVVYSVVLRLRELFMIKKFLSNQKYSKIDFLRFVDDEVYSAYLRVKRNEREINDASPNHLIKILSLSEKWIKELKERKKALKV